jgi:hypothetical protein
MNFVVVNATSGEIATPREGQQWKPKWNVRGQLQRMARPLRRHVGSRDTPKVLKPFSVKIIYVQCDLHPFSSKEIKKNSFG